MPTRNDPCRRCGRPETYADVLYPGASARNIGCSKCGWSRKPVTGIATFETSTERLLAAAASIEAHPENWDQREWIGGIEHEPGPGEYEGRGSCETTACAAGWLVLHTPKGRLPELVRSDWVTAGAISGGMDHWAARALFLAGNDEDVPSVLRGLAALPEEARTQDAVRALLDGETVDH